MSNKEYKKLYYIKNKEAILLKCKLYRQNNKKTISEKKKEYAKSDAGKLYQINASLKYTTKNKLKTGTRYRTIEQVSKSRYRSILSNAKIRKINVDLTFQDVYNFMKMPCNYCGVVKLSNFGLDRINSTLGYSIDNCVPCCKKCNTSKLDQTVEEFKEHITNIYNYFIKDK